MRTIKEIMRQIGSILDEDKLLTAINIDQINHKPHKYVVGPKHKDLNNKYLNGGSIVDKIPQLEEWGAHCYYKGCKLSHKEHTSETVLFVSLNRDMRSKEAAKSLVKIKSLLEEENINGISFLGESNGYKFIDKESKDV